MPADRLVLKEVTVDFPIYDLTSRSLRHRLVLNRMSKLIGRTMPAVGGKLHFNNQGTVIVRALDDINFALSDGDRVGLVGHNGAGKTTLLRVAAGIYEPTVGQVSINGRATTLFNIMEGLISDDTGLEMIRVRAALFGLSPDRTEALAQDVAEFCELGEYLEMPVRTYSAGMLVRLAFALTTAFNAEILIMDEFIGAGDAGFVERAQARLKRFVEQASVLIVATHSADIVRQWCNKAALLHHGKMLEFGPVDTVLAAYDRLMHGG